MLGGTSNTGWSDELLDGGFSSGTSYETGLGASYETGLGTSYETGFGTNFGNSSSNEDDNSSVDFDKDEGVELQRPRPTFLQVSVEEEPWYEILVFRCQ